MNAQKPLGKWQHYPHEADMGIRGFGVSLSQAIEQAALGLTAIITDLTLVQANQSISLHCESSDVELLFIDFLNSLVYEMAVRKMLFSRFEIHINGTQLKATAWGEHVDQARHHPAVEVKGATYTDLQVKQLGKENWLVQCVVDV